MVSKSLIFARPASRRPGPSKEQEAWFVVRESVAHKVFCDTGGWIFVLAKKLRDFSESLSGLGAGTGVPARLNSAVLKAGLREVVTAVRRETVRLFFKWIAKLPKLLRKS